MPKKYLDQLSKFEEEAAKGQSSTLNDSYDQRVYKGDYFYVEAWWITDIPSHSRFEL